MRRCQTYSTSRRKYDDEHTNDINQHGNDESRAPARHVAKVAKNSRRDALDSFSALYSILIK